MGCATLPRVVSDSEVPGSKSLGTRLLRAGAFADGHASPQAHVASPCHLGAVVSRHLRCWLGSVAAVWCIVCLVAGVLGLWNPGLTL